MSPEDLEVRVVRLETREEEKRDQIRLLASLPSEFAVQREKLEDLEGDMNSGLVAVRKEFLDAVKRIDKRLDDRDAADRDLAKQRRQDRAALYVGAIGLLGAFLTSLLPLLFGGPT